MTERQAINALIRAIKDEGPMPSFHRQMMSRHRYEWPTLWSAIDALIASQKEGAK